MLTFDTTVTDGTNRRITVLSGTTGDTSPLQQSTNFAGVGNGFSFGGFLPQFPGLYRPEWGQIDYTLSSGAAGSTFKVWGGATPLPFVAVSRGFNAQIKSG